MKKDRAAKPPLGSREPLQASEVDHHFALRNAELGGATEGWTIIDAPFVRVCVLHLMSCAEHGGVHHFAVTGEGKTLWCSPAAIDCINNANLGAQIPVRSNP